MHDGMTPNFFFSFSFNIFPVMCTTIHPPCSLLTYYMQWEACLQPLQVLAGKLISREYQFSFPCQGQPRRTKRIPQEKKWCQLINLQTRKSVIDLVLISQRVGVFFGTVFKVPIYNLEEKEIITYFGGKYPRVLSLRKICSVRVGFHSFLKPGKKIKMFAHSGLKSLEIFGCFTFVKEHFSIYVPTYDSRVQLLSFIF